MKAKLISEFDVAEDMAWRDIDDFIGEILRLGLVEVREEAMAREIVGKPKKEKKPKEMLVPKDTDEIKKKKKKSILYRMTKFFP